MFPDKSTNNDVVSLAALHLATTVGPDQWCRPRPQPISISIHLHLIPSYLDASGKSDNVTDSLHYGHLTKAVEKRVGAKGDRSYGSPRALVDDVTEAAFRFVADAVGEDAQVVRAVQVILGLPKQILLADGFEVELTTRTSDRVLAGTESGMGMEMGSKVPGAVVRVTNLTLPVIIGVNPPERLAKQRVVVNLTFFEAARMVGDANSKAGVGEIDYPSLIQQVVKEIENSTHLTLEKLVYEIIQMAYRAIDAKQSSQIDAITVRCQKPSALSFADASGVEMTRTREAIRPLLIA